MNLFLADVIRPIVRGQIKSWLKAHPDAPPETAVDGISKRIIGDLCSAAVVERIELALRPGSPGSQPAGNGSARGATRADRAAGRGVSPRPAVSLDGADL